MYINNKVEDWLQPIPYESFYLPKFDINIFPNWLKEYIEAVTEETQVPIDAAAFTALSLLSTLIAGVFEVKPNGTSWKEVLSIFSVVGLDPANRKSAVYSLFFNTLIVAEKNLKEDLKSKITDMEIEKKQINKKIGELEKKYVNSKGEGNVEEILNEIKKLSKNVENIDSKIPTIPRFFTSDVTPEKLADLMSQQNGVFAILSSEGAELFEMISGRYSDKSSIDIYLKGFSGENVVTDRKNNTEIYIEKAILTIGLFVQLSVLKELPPRFLNRGLMQRFLISLPESLIGKRKIQTQPINESVRENFEKNVVKLVEIAFHHRMNNASSTVLTLKECARAYLDIILKDVENILGNPDINEVYKGWLGKLVGQIIRIAGLIHVANHITEKEIPLEIDINTLKKVDGLRSYFMYHTERAFDLIDDTTNTKDLDYILSKLLSINTLDDGYIGTQDLWQKVKKKFKNMKTLNELLGILEELNYIQKVTRGRKEFICLNPYLIKEGPNYTKFHLRSI